MCMHVLVVVIGFVVVFFISRSISVKNTTGCKKAAVIRALYCYFQVSLTKDVMMKVKISACKLNHIKKNKVLYSSVEFIYTEFFCRLTVTVMYDY